VTILARLRSWWRVTRHAAGAENEMDAELRAHLEAHTEHLIASGVPPEEAQRRAVLEFGSLDQTKEECRDARGANLLPSLAQDLRFGLRVLRKSPGFAAIAVATLAVGIGASTAVFSLVNGVLLRALPYRDAGRLVFLYEPIAHIPDVPLEGWGPFNADFYDWQNQSHSFQHLALFTTDSVNLSLGGNAVRVNGSRVTGEFFQTLGVAPSLGRAIVADDDRTGVPRVAVISHALWQSQFGSDAQVVGRQLLLNAESYRVIGVMPPGFHFPHGTENLETANRVTDVWMPLAMTPAQRAQRDDDNGDAIGLLKPGVSPARAQAELAAITARIDKLHPAFFQGASAAVRSFDVEITGGSRRALLIFLAAVFLVLWIACSNVASLVLARMHGRSREFSLRTALGASRGRLVRQLSVESLCLAGAGGLLGLLGAWLAIRLLVHFHPTNIPRLEEASIDGRVLLFALAVSVLTVVLFGLFPAWSASHGDVNQVLKTGSRSARGALSGLHVALTIGQVALTFVLLAGSGLLLRSFLQVQAIDKGFRPASMVSMNLHLDGRYDTPQRQIAFYRALLQRINLLPGVEQASASRHVPLGGGQSLSTVEIPGFPYDEKTLFESRNVSPHYFEALGIPVLEGRGFTDADSNPSQPVIVISRSFARKYFPNGNALGQRIHVTGQRVVVGVVGDVRQYKLESAPPMQFYLPLWETGDGSINLVARTRLAPQVLATEIRGLVHALDHTVAVADIRSGGDLVDSAIAERRFTTLLLTAFGGIALFLSLVGLYGLMTYSVEQRTAEIGIRMALGAQPGSVMGLVLRQGSRLALAGIALGFAAAWFAVRAIASLLFEVKATDMPTFAAVALLFCAVSLAACYFPARRATRVDPLISLRSE
jgi:predicted permease